VDFIIFNLVQKYQIQLSEREKDTEKKYKKESR